MKTKHLDMPFEIKSVEQSGFFSGYGSIFHNEDSYGDIVRPGAFKNSLSKWAGKNRLPPMLWFYINIRSSGEFF